jgi:hypothetical protein
MRSALSLSIPHPTPISLPLLPQLTATRGFLGDLGSPGRGEGGGGGGGSGGAGGGYSHTKELGVRRAINEASGGGGNQGTGNHTTAGNDTTAVKAVVSGGPAIASLDMAGADGAAQAQAQKQAGSLNVSTSAAGERGGDCELGSKVPGSSTICSPKTKPPAKLSPYQMFVQVCAYAATCAYCIYVYVCMHACMYVCMYVHI